MPNGRRKGNSTLKLLADLVDEDVSQEPHVPGMLTLPLHFTIVSVIVLGVALLWVSTRFAQPLSFTLLIGAVAAFGLAATLRYSQTQILDDNSRIEAFRRICKQPRFKAINNPRNELLLFSLLQISDVLPIPLRKAMVEMPDQFREERLLRYLVEPIE